MWDPPRPGLEPVSAALAGRFSTTAPPGKPLHYCFLTASPLSLHPVPSLISNCLNLPFGTQGRSWSLESLPYKQGTGDTERLPCPGAPQGPAQFQEDHSSGIIPYPSCGRHRDACPDPPSRKFLLPVPRYVGI